MNIVAPTQTSMCVRRPASCSRSSRSIPIIPASSAASTSRSSPSQSARLGATRSLGRDALRLGELIDPGGGEVEQLVERLTGERVALRGRLYLDELAVAGHDHVHVRVGARVLRVVEVEQRHPVDDADRDRRDRARQRLREPEAVERAGGGDPRARDRGAARATVGLEDVAVEPERPLTERLEVADAAERAADQALDLDRAAALLPPRGLALGALAGRGG